MAARQRGDPTAARRARATDVIRLFGCPICGASPDALDRRYRSAIRLAPCGHTVVPEDALDMQRFYEALWMSQLSEGRA